MIEQEQERAQQLLAVDEGPRHHGEREEDGGQRHPEHRLGKGGEPVLLVAPVPGEHASGERREYSKLDLRARLDQGFISPHELLNAQAHRSRQRLLAIEAGATRQKAEMDLRRLIGGGEQPIVPTVPAEDLAWGPLVGLTLLAVALVVVGLVGFRRRSVGAA